MRKLLFQTVVKKPLTEPAPLADDPELLALAEKLKRKIDSKFAGSLSIRAVDAGSCNACELEIHALNNPFYDLERFGLKFVASPRHADILLVTGPVTQNMREALQRAYDATPSPKWVVAMGACAGDGGVFAQNPACLGGVEKVAPVDLYIPGCPPAPLTLIKGFLALVGG